MTDHLINIPFKYSERFKRNAEEFDAIVVDICKENIELKLDNERLRKELKNNNNKG